MTTAFQSNAFQNNAFQIDGTSNSQYLAITLDDVTVAISQGLEHSQALAAALDGITVSIAQINSNAPVVEQYSGGYETWNPAYLVNRKRRDEIARQVPKAVKQAIRKIIRLELPEQDAEIALRLKALEYEWNNAYLEYMRILQAELAQSISNEQNALRNRQLYGAALLEIARQQALEESARQALKERNRRITLIMQLI